MAALSGIRILDLSRVLAGPYCTMVLADLGADVIKLERPGSGDDTRSWSPPTVGGEAVYFLSVNRSKRSCVVDVRRPEGREVARRLATRSDVVIENFRAGTADRLGLGYDQLGDANPRLVYCSITGFGADRVPPDRAGYDFIAQAESGWMAITGAPDGEPMKVGVAVIDVIAGLNAAVGILAALQARERTGRGERIEISLLDSAFAALVNVAGNALATAEEPTRYGNAHASIVPYQTFRTSDGWIAVAAANDDLFRRLCGAIDRSELALDPRFGSNAERVEHRNDLVALLASIFASGSTDEWVARLELAGVPAGRVRGVLDAIRHASSLGRPAAMRVTHPTAGPLELVESPIRSRDGARPPEPPPLLGQHTHEVLREAGYAQEEIDVLERAGVVSGR